CRRCAMPRPTRTPARRTRCSPRRSPNSAIRACNMSHRGGSMRPARTNLPRSDRTRPGKWSKSGRPTGSTSPRPGNCWSLPIYCPKWSQVWWAMAQNPGKGAPVEGESGVRLSRVIGLTACVLAGTAGAGYLYAGWSDVAAIFERKQPLAGVRKPLVTQQQLDAAAVPAPAAEPSETAAPVQVAAMGNAFAPLSVVDPAQQVAAVETTPTPAAPVTAPERPDALPIPASEVDDDGNVTPMLEGRRGGKRGLVILQIGDSHTSADFLTGELRRRLQAKYGAGAPGYITAGQPHIGVRSS